MTRLTEFDAEHIHNLAKSVNKLDGAKAFLEDLPSAVEQIHAGSATRPVRSRKLHPTKALREDETEWRGPKKASLTVKATETGEKAAQRAYFLHGEICVGGRAYTLLDLEFPTRPGDFKIDLLAVPSDGSSTRSIIELKYGKPAAAGESPVAALLQGLSYVIDAHVSHDVLKRQYRHDVSRRDIPRFPPGWTPELIVAANECYWAAWRDKLGGAFQSLVQLATSVTQRTELPVAFAEFADLPVVERTPHPRGRYLPRVPCSSCAWSVIASTRG